MSRDGEGEQVGLRLDEGRVDADQMRQALAGPRAEAWSSVTLGVGLPYDDLELWLVSALPEFALLAATAGPTSRPPASPAALRPRKRS